MPTLDEINQAYANLGVNIPQVPNINPMTMASGYANVANAQNTFATLGQRAPVQQGWVNARAGIDLNDLMGNYTLRSNYLGDSYRNTADRLGGQRSYDLDRLGAMFGYQTGRTNAEADFNNLALGRRYEDTTYGLGRTWSDTQANLGQMRDVTLSGEAGQLAAIQSGAAGILSADMAVQQAREAAAQREYANHVAMLQLQRQRDLETLMSSSISRGVTNAGFNDVTRQRFATDYGQRGTELSNARQAVLEAAAAARQQATAANANTLARAQADYAYAVARANAGYDVGMRNGLTDYDLGMRGAQTGYDLGVGQNELGRTWDNRRAGIDYDFGTRAANDAYNWSMADLDTQNAYQSGLNELGYITGVANVGLNQDQSLTGIGWNLADAGTAAQLAATHAYLSMLASSGR